MPDVNLPPAPVVAGATPLHSGKVRDLYRLAAERDVQIRKLSHRHDSLEDIFLKAMETEPEKAEAANGRL